MTIEKKEMVLILSVPVEEEQKVGEDFVFAVKAPGSVTHERDSDPAPLVAGFLEAVAPLGEGPILLQFPFSFRYRPANRIYLARTLDAFPDHRAGFGVHLNGAGFGHLFDWYDNPHQHFSTRPSPVRRRDAHNMLRPVQNPA